MCRLLPRVEAGGGGGDRKQREQDIGQTSSMGRINHLGFYVKIKVLRKMQIILCIHFWVNDFFLAKKKHSQNGLLSLSLFDCTLNQWGLNQCGCQHQKKAACFLFLLFFWNQLYFIWNKVRVFLRSRSLQKDVSFVRGWISLAKRSHEEVQGWRICEDGEVLCFFVVLLWEMLKWNEGVRSWCLSGHTSSGIDLKNGLIYRWKWSRISRLNLQAFWSNMVWRCVRYTTLWGIR